MESDASGAVSEITTVQSLMSGEDGKQVGEVAQPPKLRVGPKRPQVASICAISCITEHFCYLKY